MNKEAFFLRINSDIGFETEILQKMGLWLTPNMYYILAMCLIK